MALPLILLLGLTSPTTAGMNADMARLATRSPLARQARSDVRRAIAGLTAPVLRARTRSALLKPAACIAHRVGLDAAAEGRIIATLRTEQMLEAGISDVRARQSLFPPLADADGPCPHLPLPVLSAPGGNSGSHHSWPGGLAVHLSTNLAEAQALARSYRPQHGLIDRDRLSAAILWHDWAKALVLSWQPNGTTMPELRVAGTGAHHILGLAEAMRQGLPPAQVAAQACAHAAPESAGLAPVARWLRAAAIVARQDPVRWPAADSIECRINNLADQNWVLEDAALATAEQRLATEALDLGFDPVDTGGYNRDYRNPALARLGAVAIATLSPSLLQQRLRRLFRRFADLRLRGAACASPRPAR
jgi:hypothetical protein